MTLGDIVKAYRLDHCYSMAAFAKMCGLSRGYISILESNKSPHTGKPLIPSMETFMRIAKVMGLTLDDLMKMCDSSQLVTVSDASTVKDNYEAELYYLWDDLTDSQKRVILSVASEMVKENGKAEE